MRTNRHVLALLALAVAATSLAGSAPPSGAAAPVAQALAAPPAANDTGRFWSRLLGEARGDLRAAWMDAATAVAERRRPVARIEHKPSNGPVLGRETYSGAGFAGDLNGDRRSDVVTIADTYRRHQYVHVFESVDVAAFAGDTGRRLWRTDVKLPEPDCEYAHCGYFMRLGFAYPRRVATGNGIELVVLSSISDNAFDYRANPLLPGVQWGAIFAVDVVHLDGKGRELWSRRVSGRFDVNQGVVTARELPVLQDFGRTEGGKLDDLLFTVLDGRFVGNLGGDGAGLLAQLPVRDPTHTVPSSRIVALDARTGRTREIGPPVYGSAAVRDVVAVADLSRDRRDDLLELRPPWSTAWSMRRPEADSVITALRSSDGARLWRRDFTPMVPLYVTGTGDVDGNGGPDVLVYLMSGHTYRPSQVALLTGATGAVLWTKEALDALPPDEAADRRRVVLLTSLDAPKRRVTVTAYDSAGRRRWAATRRVAADQPGELSWANAGHAGDLDGDGYSDVAIVAVTTQRSGNSTRSTHVLLGFASGRTGRVHTLPKDASSAYGPVDGRGDDIATRHPTGITVRSGHDGTPLWRVDFGRRVRYAWAETDGTPGRCGHLLVGAWVDSGSTSSFVLGSFHRSGRLLWAKTVEGRTSARPWTTARAAYRC